MIEAVLRVGAALVSPLLNYLIRHVSPGDRCQIEFEEWDLAFDTGSRTVSSTIRVIVIPRYHGFLWRERSCVIDHAGERRRLPS